ncbi:MAG TPA: transketolase [Candidatus Limiplasma pullicola]|nr:transketolase [Candidatus Limiplasma pullicola]
MNQPPVWNQARAGELEALCRQFRVDVLTTLHKVGTGHPGGSLSVCEILAVLYLQCANISPDNWEDPDRDRVVLTKGHAAPMLYRILAQKGFFPLSEMDTLRQLGSRLQGHPCAGKLPGIELSTGPLGMGLSASLGMALTLRVRGSAARVYAVTGDGELNEGTVWEAAMAAAKFRADNLIAIVDRNRVQLDGPSDEVMPLGDLEAKWRSFGWYTQSCDGHDVRALHDAVLTAQAHRGAPCVIIANTVKGKGVSFMEGKNTYHGKQLTDDEYARAMTELKGETAHGSLA